MKVDFVVDAGNTFTKWGRCVHGAVTDIAFLYPWDHRDNWQKQLEQWDVTPDCQWAVTGSDLRRRDDQAAWLRKQNQHVHVIHSYQQLPLTLQVNQPEKVGLDRLLNAVAVNQRRPPGSPAVIIDAGTAVTVDYVDEAGIFQGGAILPGILLMAKALHDYTSALPLVEIPKVEIPKSFDLPGKSTIEAVSVGIFHGMVGSIEHLLGMYAKKAPKKAQIFFGGGDAMNLASALSYPEIQIWPEMTLEGIRLSAEQKE